MTFGPVASPGGGGGGDGTGTARASFADYLPVDPDSLKGATATSTLTAAHTLTLGGNDARSITVTTTASSGTYVGPWTVSGHGPDNGLQLEELTMAANGNETVETHKTFKPGTVTVSRPAQSNASGSYMIGVGNSFGLPTTAAAEESAVAYAGHLLSLVQDGDTTPAQIAIDPTIGGIVGPTVSPPYGALRFQAQTLDNLGSFPFAITYAT